MIDDTLMGEAAVTMHSKLALGQSFAEHILRYEPAAFPAELNISDEAGEFFERLHLARTTANPAAWQKLVSAKTGSGYAGKDYVVLPGELTADAHPGRVYMPPGEKLPIPMGDSAHVVLDHKQRTRFVVRDIGTDMDSLGATDGLWIHVVMSIELAAQDDPLAGIRVFLGNSDEETLVRFRDGSMVFLQEIRSPLPPGGQPFLISIGVKDGVATIYCDGLPRHRRDFKLSSITGFVVDIASQSERECRAKFHAISLQRGSDRPFWVSPDDELLLANTVRASGLTRSRSEQWRTLHAMSGFGGDLIEQQIVAPLENNRRSEPYMPQLETLLMRGVSKEPDGITVAPPTPLVRIEKAVVTLSSNPDNHTIWPFGTPRDTSVRRVVDGVSFEAFKGDIIGILGRNGAGKSTLLKTLVGAMPLTEGRIEISGKAVLLRPGAGMQPTLTGRQNIIKTGLYMNMQPKEIAEKIPEIAAFAELEDHLDRPFKYYSDGMRSRLIFSIATAMPYDILLLDELLSAGDIGFQKRVTERLDQVIERAKLLIVVQHTFDFIVSRCTKCLVMENGKPVFFGDPHLAAELYREKVS